MMKQLAAYVTAQDATVVSLSNNIIDSSCGVSGGSRNTDKKKTRPRFHMCTHCKQEVYHKDANCLELEANKAKRYPGWKSVFAKE